MSAVARVGDRWRFSDPRRQAACRLAMWLALGTLAGCAAPEGSGAASSKAAISARSPEVMVVPAGAVAVGDDLYQVPIGRDADGCLMYRLYSPRRMVSLAISYRATDGSFTMDHQRAVCDPGLMLRR